ncbi:protein of unknown function (plasmid) [Cupriavidus taiwanensis]|uniref:Uncharacterized protein n=1 Tax=Cupriavidus taiwanensis TaxID=164546 RepID=A0A9Q7XRV9_9BURK|nr:protein of unknown function [Cupriavidus taiwanensis]
MRLAQPARLNIERHIRPSRPYHVNAI